MPYRAPERPAISTHPHLPTGAEPSRAFAPRPSVQTHPIEQAYPNALRTLLAEQSARFASIFGSAIAGSIATLSPARLPVSMGGWLAGDPKSPLGYALVLDSAPRPVITSLWVSRAESRRGRVADALLRAVLDNRQHRDAVTEAQDLVFGDGDLSESIAEHAIERHPRLLMDHRQEAAPKLPREIREIREIDDIRLREYRHGDLLAVATLIQRSFSDSLDSRLNSEYCSLAGCLRRCSAAVSGVAWGPLIHSASLIARVGESNELAGCILVTDLGASHAHVVDVAVSPRHKGRGLGRLLVESSLQRAQRKGIQRVSLCVSPGNRGAHSLYQRTGFQARREFNAYLLGHSRKATSGASVQPLATDTDR